MFYLKISVFFFSENVCVSVSVYVVDQIKAQMLYRVLCLQKKIKMLILYTPLHCAEKNSIVYHTVCNGFSGI